MDSLRLLLLINRRLITLSLTEAAKALASLSGSTLSMDNWVKALVAVTYS